jgi:quercetin dioxygenase-like cupin family protein
LEVVKMTDVSAEKSAAEIFTGTVHRQQILDGPASKQFRVGVVSFSPGARTKWHTHSSEQVVYVLDGKGIVATEQKEVVVGPGTIICFAADEVHWHGATEDTSFIQMAVSTPCETKVLK